MDQATAQMYQTGRAVRFLNASLQGGFTHRDGTLVWSQLLIRSSRFCKFDSTHGSVDFPAFYGGSLV